MKNRRLISLFLIVVMLVSSLLFAAPAMAASPSTWAVPEMNEANINGLLTPSAARDYRKDLTRDEFCEIVVKMVESVKGTPLPLPPTNPFNDTNSTYILKAYQYGITNGTTPTTFSPNQNVQRQQICAMMLRAIQGLEKDLGRALLSPPALSLPYSDAKDIDQYALEAARYAYTNDIMRGDENRNVFTPKSPITSEQCVAVAIRSFKRMENVLAPYRTTDQNLDATERRLTIGYAFGDSEYGVTQNIVLPTKGAGGALVTWTSNNTSVITIGGVLYNTDNIEIGRSGIVSVGSSAQTVILTATITIAGSSQTRTQEFTLRTSTQKGDQLLIENAYSLLDIDYINEGDSANSVTGRIGLPNKVLDLPVTWSSNNTSVVTNTGLVYPASGAEIRYATLTATIRNGSQTRTKTFTLTVVNALYNRSVTLNGVELGSTPARVQQVLGAPTKTIQASNAESWNLYYSGSYSNFIAVAFVSSRAVAVFSMTSNVTNQLKNNAGIVITVEQANAINGVNAVSYADASQQYGIMVYETNSTIGSQRTLTAERQEEFLLDLVNAYRVRYGRSALEWTEKLRTPTRAHSDWLRSTGSAPTIGTGVNALSYRAEAEGFFTSGNQPRYGGGNALAGQNDAFGFFREMASTAAMRNEILDSNVSMFGAGLVSTTSGTYRTYMTYALGIVKFITNVTASPVSGTPATIRISGAGSKVTVTLAFTYTSLVSSNNYLEPFTVTSSNDNRITVAHTAGSNTCEVTGASMGDANLVITGTLSGKIYNIPVNVGAVYASSLQVTYPQNGEVPAVTLTNSATAADGNCTLIVGQGEVLNLTANATPATAGTTPTVVWTQAGVNYDSVSSLNNGASYSFRPTSSGTATVTASVPSSTGANITHTITVRVLATPTFTQSPTTVNKGEQVTLTAGLVSPTGASPTDCTWSSNSNVLSISSSNKETLSAVFNADNTGTATVTFTAVWSTVQYRGKVTGQQNVTVSGSAYATGLTLSPNTIYLVSEGSSSTASIAATITPSEVLNNAITWKSDNEGVAVVSGGTVTAVGPGTATITATMAKSATEPEGITASVEVVVIEPIKIIVGGIGVDGIWRVTSVYVGVMGLDSLPPGALTIQWTSTYESVATVDPDTGLFTAHNPGETTITVKVTNSSGVVLTSDSITVIVE